MVCPTCFCTTTEDVTDLTGDHAERWRRWDSCFDFDFSYVHAEAGPGRHRQPLPAVDHPQAEHLARPVRHLRLRRLRPVHRLVPRRHRHHRRGRGARRPRHGRGERRGWLRPAPSPGPPRGIPCCRSATPSRTRRWRRATASPSRSPRWTSRCRAFRPGQFTMMYVPGVGEIAVSISGDPAAAGDAIMQTVRAVGAVSGALHDARPGRVLGLRGPVRHRLGPARRRGCGPAPGRRRHRAGPAAAGAARRAGRTGPATAGHARRRGPRARRLPLPRPARLVGRPHGPRPSCPPSTPRRRAGAARSGW